MMEIGVENEKKNQLKTKSPKLYSPRRSENNYEILASQKKIANEISSMTKEFRNDFRKALTKYSFDTEVFIPKTISINKNEYKNKNYLLNNLVSFENKAQERKKLVEPLKKETSRFSKQYKLILEENEEHQKEYLRDLEKYYKDIGYNLNSIEYKKTDNIFSPSTILDHNFGINIQDDVCRYSSVDLKKDYNKDQKLMRKWQKGIKDTKENKSRAKRMQEENEMRGIKNEEIKEIEREKEMKKDIFQKQLEKIKKDLIEENKIMSMSREEYFFYSHKIKNDINNTKKLLEEFNENKNNSFLIQNILTINSFQDNKSSKTYKILHPTKQKNYKEKIVYSSFDMSNTNTRKKENKEIKDKKKKVVKNYLLPKYQIRNNLKDKPPVSVTENNIFISLNKKKGNSFQKLPSILNTEQPYNETSKARKNNIYINKKDEVKSEMMTLKLNQENELDNLYNLVYSNKNNILEGYPSKSVEAYFRKYTNKRIPTINYKRGSNIHGLLDDLQQNVKKKDFYKIAESSNDVKKEYINKRGLSYTKLTEDKNFDVDKIQELDYKIPELHYIFAENLLVNKAKKSIKKSN